jgi:general secretion pathway protein A
MYQKFYGLTRNPFEVSPDPFFFYPMPCHTEALSILNYGVLRRKGIAVVTGEVGTGKTLLVRCLLDGLSRNQIAFAFVYNPMLSVLDFLSHVLTDLRVPTSAGSKSEMLSRLNNFLVARAQRGEITALVVDEAQLLSWELLEEIRLLTNLETSEYKLLQIVLAGQPELDCKLDSHELRQLKQRIGLRCSLEPLKLKELSGYIYRRLELAGANSQGNAIFSDEAIDSIYLLSRGIPRLVNIICDNSMISGYGTQTKQITPDIIRSVAMDLRLNNVTASPVLRPGDSKLLRSLFNVIEEL